MGSSLDGASAETHDWMRGKEGAFETTIANFAKLKEAGVDFIVQCTIHRRNVDEIEDIINLAFAKGACTVYVLTACGVGRAPENSDVAFLMDEVKRIGEHVLQIRDKLKNHVEFDVRHTPFNSMFRVVDPRHAKRKPRRGNRGRPKASPDVPCDRSERGVKTFGFPALTCSAGMTSMSITGSGKVYPCVDAAGAQIAEIGDLNDDDVLSIWRSESWDLYRGGFTPDELPVCRECQSSDVCGVKKCRAYPAAALGDPYGPKPECLRNFKRLGIDRKHVMSYRDHLADVFDAPIALAK